MRKKIPLFLGILLFCCLSPIVAVQHVYAVSSTSEVYIKVVIEEVLEDSQCSVGNDCRILRVKALDEPVRHKIYSIELEQIGNIAESKTVFHEGDIYYASYVKDLQTGKEVVQLAEQDRSFGLLILGFLFIFVVVLFAGKQGIYALLALIVNFFILVWIITQGLFSGWHVMVLALGGGGLMMFFSLFLTYGFQKKTLAAFLGSLIGLVLTFMLLLIFIPITHLTGFSTEESSFLVDIIGGVSIIDVLYLGIMIGMMGVLDDVAVAQSSTTFEIARANPSLSDGEIFKKSMTVGKDHLASMINTLIVAYAGAAFPLFLLLAKETTGDIWHVINMEIISEEIVRMFIGSIGLILSIPITTYLASRLAKTHK